VIHSNHFVSQRIDELSRQVQYSGDDVSDHTIVKLFSRANSEILEAIKNDHSLLQEFEGASMMTSDARVQRVRNHSI
jgi:hypothetical protein